MVYKSRLGILAAIAFVFAPAVSSLDLGCEALAASPPSKHWMAIEDDYSSSNSDGASCHNTTDAIGGPTTTPTTDKNDEHKSQVIDC